MRYGLTRFSHGQILGRAPLPTKRLWMHTARSKHSDESLDDTPDVGRRAQEPLEKRNNDDAVEEEDFSNILTAESRRARSAGLQRRSQEKYSLSFGDSETQPQSANTRPLAPTQDDHTLWARRHSSPSATSERAQPFSLRPSRWTFTGDRPKKEVEAPTWTADQATRPLLLTFDAFGTLFAPKAPIEEQYSTIARNYGLDIPASTILPSFKAAFKKLNASHPNYGKATNTPVHVWWAHIIADTLTPLLPEGKALPGALIRELYTRFASDQGYTLFPDVQNFLSTIGTAYSAATWPPKRTMLGILSNSDPRVRDILSSFDIPILPSLFPPRYNPHSPRFHVDFGPATFGFSTLSYEAGFSKPNKGIYSSAIRDAQSVLERLAYVARLTRTGMELLGDIRQDFHCMHVGDELEKDVLPAIRCGWDGVLIDRDQDLAVDYRSVEMSLNEDDDESSSSSGKDASGVPQDRLTVLDENKKTRTVQVPVIKNFMALRQLVTKERLQNADGSPRQTSVYYDESMSVEDVMPPRQGKNRRYYAGRRTVEHPLSSKETPLYMLE